MDFPQVVCEPRHGQKRKNKKVSNNELPNVTCIQTRGSLSDHDEDEVGREALIEELQQLVVFYTCYKISQTSPNLT